MTDARCRSLASTDASNRIESGVVMYYIVVYALQDCQDAIEERPESAFGGAVRARCLLMPSCARIIGLADVLNSAAVRGGVIDSL